MRTTRDRKSRRPGGLNSSVWERLRRIVLQRDQFQCQVCKRFGKMEVDHIIPSHKGGSNELDNLQAICKDCHIDKTEKEMYALRGRHPYRYAPGFRELVKELRK